jgi:hypothetical protein
LTPINFDPLFSDPGAYLRATVIGYGYITSWRLDRNVLSRRSIPRAGRSRKTVPSRGTAGIVGSGATISARRQTALISR